ncbi:MAG: hypothetical protein UX02_C0001G0383 [Candidatus Moranbacteria bacterium GW2011_GWC1_45_18]|nr:MAG: hypothetical protein UT79_C0002G0013 [Candidatus Moranbacteria bacterium GW2011_GWC2_40_12]KKT33837.1 MAG: hypothetical protein UW19_C0005G0083 [Candidatus Moranbacteria bacterium GW2011_GWF2_44_10]KKT69674.1 MAG: hypothetical protein UW66_C0065G0002 [Candidatus Moranbacteria bacterium GW2011_GWF1_44_4]KKU00935.1 MAG: hypothetical protein UX02_C0001G0383 [Candidatus Moranbacteria bacterium GW2011_GWC1_45_18]OGI24371.1 MAG: hypothetical protein A2194_02765 [Candidatus Moranbacteria bacte
MPIEKQEKLDQEEKLPAIYDKSIKVLTDGGLDNDSARELIVGCYEKFQKQVTPGMIISAWLEYIQQNPVEGKDLDDEDDNLIIAQLAKIIQEKFSSKAGKAPKIIYKGGGINITESSNN